MQSDSFPIKRIKCTLCSRLAITTSGGIPTCLDHDKMYADEGRAALLDVNWPNVYRPFWERLQSAFDQHGRVYIEPEEAADA